MTSFLWVHRVTWADMTSGMTAGPQVFVASLTVSVAVCRPRQRRMVNELCVCWGGGGRVCTAHTHITRVGRISVLIKQQQQNRLWFCMLCNGSYIFNLHFPYAVFLLIFMFLIKNLCVCDLQTNV